MISAAIDPEYYANNEDGSEPHGYWIKSTDWYQKQRLVDEANKAVREGRACWVAGPLGQNDTPGGLPF